MKKFNKNMLVFAFFIVFIIIGIWGDCFEQLKWKTIDLAAGIKHGNISSFFDYKYYVDDISNKELSYHDAMMDVNSIKENLLGTRVVIKDDTKVVKSNSGKISELVIYSPLTFLPPHAILPQNRITKPKTPLHRRGVIIGTQGINLFERKTFSVDR